MVGGSQRDYADIGGEAVKLVEEEGAVLGRQQRVEILKDEYTWRCLASSIKYRTNIVLIGGVLGANAFHVQARLAHSVDDSFDCVRLAIARRADEKNATFPGYVVRLVHLTGRKELF